MTTSSPDAREPASRFTAPDLDALPADIAERLLAVQEKSGFVPNVFLLLARRPDEFRAFLAYHDVLMDRPGILTKAEREMIVVATSAANRCLYCVVAHGAILRIRAKDPLIADRIAIDHRKAGLTDRQVAMLDFALKVATEAQAIDDADHAALARHGFDAEGAWDIAALAGCFALANRLAGAADLRPNPEFFGLGR
jgi:uncharacterized peroxidase-related enzyme